MEIQQHDGVVVEAAGISAGLRQAQREGEVSREGEGGARGCGAAALPPAPLYIGPLGGAPALGDPISRSGAPPGAYVKGGGGRAATPQVLAPPSPLLHLSLSQKLGEALPRSLLHPPPRRRATGSSSTSPSPLLDQEGGYVFPNRTCVERGGAVH